MTVAVSRRGAVSAARTRVADIPKSGLRGHWRADRLPSPLVNGSVLPTWPDSSGNGHNLTAGASAPQYWKQGAFLPNGLPALQFAAANAQHFTANLGNNTATTKFFVVRLNSLPRASFSIFGGPNGYQVSVDSTGKLDVAVTNVSWVIYGKGSHVLVTNRWYILAVTSNGSSSTTSYVNGTQDATSTTTIRPTAVSAALGSNNTGGEHFDGYIAEVVDYNRVLAQPEFAVVDSHLKMKYGIGAAPEPPQSGAPAIVQLNYETGDFSQWTSPSSLNPYGGAIEYTAGDRNNAYGAAVVRSDSYTGATVTPRKGIHMARLRLRPADIWSNGMPRVLQGWYGSAAVRNRLSPYYTFSAYFPSNPSYVQHGNPVIWELHHRNPFYTDIPSSQGGGNAGMPPLRLVVRGNSITMSILTGSLNWNGSQYTGYPYYLPNDPMGDGTRGSGGAAPTSASTLAIKYDAWMDFILHFGTFTEQGSATISVWHRVGSAAWSAQSNPQYQRTRCPTLGAITTGPYAGRYQSDLYHEAGMYSSGLSHESVCYWDCAAWYNSFNDALSAFPSSP